MAAGVSDGAIIIDTGIDNSGIARDSRKYRSMVNGLKDSVDKTGRQMASAANGYTRAIREQMQAIRESGNEMEQLQQQVEQMGQQLQKAQEENTNLKKAVSNTSNTLSTMTARRGGNPQQQAPQMKTGTEEAPNAIVDNARNMMGVQTGASLPT